MMRYAIFNDEGLYLGKTLAGCSTARREREAKVLFLFGSDDLKYSISNPAFVQGDIARVIDSYGHDHLASDRDHLMHQWIDVCEDGNWDRVSESIAIAISDIETMLYRYVRHELQSLISIDTTPELCDEYSIELSVPNEFSDTTCTGLMRYFREYIVSSVLEDWAGLTYPEAMQYWTVRKQSFEAKIKKLARIGTSAKWTTPSVI